MFFSSSVVADDISDFQIDGMSIGDSLLDFYSFSEIQSWQKEYYGKSDTFVLIYSELLSDNKFSQYIFHTKNNDSNYIIYSIRGSKFFENNIKECKQFKEKIIIDVEHLFSNQERKNYEFTYDYIEDGNSIAYINDFILDGGAAVRIYCIDWSEITEKKRNYVDNFSIDVSSQEFLFWLSNKAN
tara:strand:- start:40 stop:591 length:552 start_codon:yes stop_codon:yes gene_type:complete